MTNRVKHFHTKAVGVTHTNEDGSDRQALIGRCQILEKLVLDHDEFNAYDPNAVRVCRANGDQLGFLSAELAEELVSKVKSGYMLGAFVKNITGGTRARPTLGLNILLILAEPGVSAEEAQRYASSLDLSDAD